MFFIGDLATVLSDVYDAIVAMIGEILPTMGLVIVAGVAVWGVIIGIRLVKRALGAVTGR